MFRDDDDGGYHHGRLSPCEHVELLRSVRHSDRREGCGEGTTDSDTNSDRSDMVDWLSKRTYGDERSNPAVPSAASQESSRSLSVFQPYDAPSLAMRQD
jgi:hypothetical protein